MIKWDIRKKLKINNKILSYVFYKLYYIGYKKLFMYVFIFLIRLMKKFIWKIGDLEVEVKYLLILEFVIWKFLLSSFL